MAVLGLRFCARAFSSCGKRGPLFTAVRGPLTIAASPVAEHRLQTRRLSNMTHGPSRSAACGILPDQGSNPCPLHWQADSQPLRHQGSPQMTLLQALFSSFHFCETCWAFLLEDPGSTFPFPGLSWCCLLSSKKKLSPACSHILSSICSPSGCEFGCKLTRAHLSNQFL